MPPNASHLLGPFIGNVNASTAMIWLQIPHLAAGELRTVFVTLHEASASAPVSFANAAAASYDNLNVGTVKFDQLKPDTVYYYKLWQDEQHAMPLDLNGLTENDLHFRTLPLNGFDDQLDFLLMSCHNPGTSLKDGAEGYAVWARIPEIISENENVRFALLAGDQVYGDEIETELKKEPDLRKRQELYLDVYRKFWDNLYYRRVLCSLPALLMWDDHDITDGWGSRDDSFIDNTSAEFDEGWLRLFEAGRSVFLQMQASRNPEPLSKGYEDGFDFCFKVGRAGFAVPDLRSKRNVRVPRIMSEAQLDGIRKWIADNKQSLDLLFFVSTVVFSHGAPEIDRGIIKYWIYLLDFTHWLAKVPLIRGLVRRFHIKVGDIRDDINDSWGADVNSAETDRVLDFLFDLQNPSRPEDALNVVILSGDIHTPGYSTLYSADAKHARKAIIPHIVATPVAFRAFPWLAEAILRHRTITVALGEKETYSAQVSHHYCYRNVVILSLRKFEPSELQLKVKYYLEHHPEPQIMLFDLNRSSHRETIEWNTLPSG
ncbi:MAG: hypothetical protein DMF71_01365 [Acidobacteria bacterium]|nr:MAG: hypothetical protein DMF71_01365 [Acidobacteriota bacterium]